MKEKFEAYCSALERLNKALQSEPTEMNRDATIQRFEFTYELAWNILKKYLAQIGIDCLNPRDCFMAAFQQKIIDLEDEDTWIGMIKDRNLSSHVYDEDTAKKIYDRVKLIYFIQFRKLQEELKERLKLY
ncbi:MAG: nucleotidyltransferase substrate binding protein [Candidatus Margulisbacteria bacterium]|nr:nucleotidyltransferase substrate binding protein [Candidatus Margulisiibacteriota bacterium]